METYETYEKQIIYNDDNSINLSFGHAAEWYLTNIPLLQNYRLKNQSRQVTPKLVKNSILTIERTQGAIDYLEWTTTTRTKKSTNRIDDILVLTTKGEDLVSQINLGIEKDQQCWYWVMYCSGNGNICQHLYGGIGKCLETCNHYLLYNNLKNANDMHLCSVRVISECRLSDSIALSRRADHRTAKGIKAKLLTPFNGASEEVISKALA
ncbi:3342_t:CDS:2, partial [Funneliformis caledonium]